MDDTPIPDRYEKYIEKGCEKLELSDEVKDIAKKLISEMPSASTQGRFPKTVAAGAVYISSYEEKEGKSQKEMSEAFNVSTTTISNYYPIILEESDYEATRLREFLETYNLRKGGYEDG